MKIKMKVSNIGADVSEAWDEEVDTETTRCLDGTLEGMAPMYYAGVIVKYFNDTLKPGETLRMVLSAEEIT